MTLNERIARALAGAWEDGWSDDETGRASEVLFKMKVKEYIPEAEALLKAHEEENKTYRRRP